MTEKAGSFVLPADMTVLHRQEAANRRSGAFRRISSVAMLLCAWAISALAAEDEKRAYEMPAGDAAERLGQFSSASGREVLFGAEVVRGVRTQAVRGTYTASEVVERMLAGTDLVAMQDEQTGALAVRRRQFPPQLPADAIIQASLADEFQVAPASVRRGQRGVVMRTVEPLLIQQARYLVGELQPWPADQRGARLPLLKGKPSGEHGIRPNAHTAKGLAILYRFLPDDAFPPEFSREKVRDAALALLRPLLATHGAGGGRCEDNRPWGSQWQSAHWAALAGEAAWLLWDHLSPAERWLAARMIADEADRFSAATPPTARERDSKAEENAWNSQILSLAGLMFTRHAQAVAWREAAVRWIASSFARPADLALTDLVDGRPQRDWLAGANLHDDFTLENHSRIHPDYMACTYLLTSQVPMYDLGGRTPPAALHLNVEAINASLKRLALPDGAWIYPNGQDWGLRRNIDWFEYHTALAVLYGDAQSATLQRQCLATMQRMAARTPIGAIYLPEETKLPSDQAMALELPAHAYALMAERGEGPAPVSVEQLMADLSGRHVFAAGKFAVMRTSRSIATFSWGAQVMGQVMALEQNQLLAPEARSLIGYVAMAGQAREAPVAREIVVAPLRDAFGVAGVLARADGAVEQRFAFLVLPDGRVIYADALRLTGTQRPTLLDLGTLGVLNDVNWPAHNGRRTLVHEGGTQVFAATAASSEPAAMYSSRWFNLDGLGIVRVAASGDARYMPTPTGAAGRLEQRFHLNANPAAISADRAPGTTLAHVVLVFYPGQTPEGTRRAAAQCRLDGTIGTTDVRLTLEDGSEATIDLAHLSITWRESR